MANEISESLHAAGVPFTETNVKDMKELLVTKGYSYTSPVYDGDGKEDQEKSRRVEIRYFIKID